MSKYLLNIQIFKHSDVQILSKLKLRRQNINSLNASVQLVRVLNISNVKERISNK